MHQSDQYINFVFLLRNHNFKQKLLFLMTPLIQYLNIRQIAFTLTKHIKTYKQNIIVKNLFHFMPFRRIIKSRNKTKKFCSIIMFKKCAEYKTLYECSYT